MIDVKICGIRTVGDLAAAEQAGARWIGMVFFDKSPRYLSLDEASLLRDASSVASPARVALTVDADDAMLEAIVSAAEPAMLQCHGGEPPERIREIKSRFGLNVMKAIRVEGTHSLDAAMAYDGVADWMLFDSAPASASLPGGTGHRFDWGLMQNWKGQCPWMLAGGLTAENVARAAQISGATAVDVSSHVEKSPGIKDHDAIQGFVSAAISAKQKRPE